MLLALDEKEPRALAQPRLGTVLRLGRLLLKLLKENRAGIARESWNNDAKIETSE